MKQILPVVLVALSACASPYQEGIGSGTPPLSRVDRDKDGFISLDEARQFPSVSEAFDRLDRDEDGKLSEDEYRAEGGSAGPTGSGEHRY